VRFSPPQRRAAQDLESGMVVSANGFVILVDFVDLLSSSQMREIAERNRMADHHKVIVTGPTISRGPEVQFGGLLLTRSGRFSLERRQQIFHPPTYPVTVLGTRTGGRPPLRQPVTWTALITIPLAIAWFVFLGRLGSPSGLGGHLPGWERAFVSNIWLRSVTTAIILLQSFPLIREPVRAVAQRVAQVVVILLIVAVVGYVVWWVTHIH
jgi:hypothetical protein